MTPEEIIKKYKEIPYNTDPYESNEGTFRKHKLKNKKMEIGRGYHLNPYTYELEETKQTWER